MMIVTESPKRQLHEYLRSAGLEVSYLYLYVFVYSSSAYCQIVFIKRLSFVSIFQSCSILFFH